MAKITFLQVLKSNLKCAVCKKEDCPVRYYPERKVTHRYNSSKVVVSCEKDQKSYQDKALKRKLP